MLNFKDPLIGIPGSTSGHFRQRNPPFSFKIVALNFTNCMFIKATNNKKNL